MLRREINHIGVFAGLGGFEYAAMQIGWKTVAWCEINEFCQRILKYYFPEAIAHTDIRNESFKQYANGIDILTGGFPCQPYSAAGKRKGKEDNRHLWPEMLRAFREIRPRWGVGENVFGIVNWSGGLVFEEVQADLEAEGYEVFAYVLPACAVDAPHRRDRTWFVCRLISDTGGNGQIRNKEFKKGFKNNTDGLSCDVANALPESRIITDTDGAILQGCKKEGKRLQQQTPGWFKSIGHVFGNWEKFPTEYPVCSGNDGLSERLDGITFPKWREETIKAYGNAIVPQVAFEIFKAIEAYEKLSA